MTGDNFLLDTDICTARIRGHRKVFNRGIQHGGAIALSTATLGELLVQATLRGPQSKFARGVARLQKDLLLLLFDVDCAKRFGEVRADLLSRGLVVGVPDCMIGATALVHDLTLVTRNLKHFSNIPGLRLQDWTI
jgi:predicted nucleic acid-binding protein